MSAGLKIFSWFVLLTIASSVSAKQYYIYGDEKNGTKFRDQLYAWNVPLNKSYRKLSDEQKAIVRIDYPGLEDNDVPPYPAKGIAKILKPFVKKYRWYGEFNSETIFADVNSNGRVVKVYGPPESYAVIAEYMNWLLRSVEFEPGTCAGSPCLKTFVLNLSSVNNPK